MLSFDPILFRGEPELIRARMKKYFRVLPKEGKLLDLGCGRGELLELCRAEKIEAVGVEKNEARLATCRRLGLTVVADDAFHFLKQSSELYTAVVASHFIEHLHPAQLLELLQLILQRLKPRGRLLLIWPNFQSPFVALNGFWLDPTHIRPYPPELIAAILEGNGCTIKASGEDPDTLPISRPAPLRSRLFRWLFPQEAQFIQNFWNRAQDLFLVAEKCS